MLQLPVLHVVPDAVWIKSGGQSPLVETDVKAVGTYYLDI